MSQRSWRTHTIPGQSKIGVLGISVSMDRYSKLVDIPGKLADEPRPSLAKLLTAAGAYCFFHMAMVSTNALFISNMDLKRIKSLKDGAVVFSSP
jgi:hypothetical protein